jgi:hypothetical protein
MKSPVILIVVLIVGAAMLASVVFNYTRETTSSEFKYSKSANEIIATYYQPLASIVEDDYYRRNGLDVPAEDTCTDINADQDIDGWINSVEVANGTRCDNPDTDGDGTIDSIDSAPLEPTQGGAPEIIPPAGLPILPNYRLFINQFYKNALNQTLGATDWTHQVTAHMGDHVRFIIYADINNNNPTDTLPCIIKDQLGKSLDYVEDNTGTINYYYVNGAVHPLTDDLGIRLLSTGLSFNIAPASVEHPNTIIEIYFETTVWPDPKNSLNVTLNSAKIQTDLQSSSDYAFVMIKSAE